MAISKEVKCPHCESPTRLCGTLSTPGTGGLRKIRSPIEDTGKRGGGRVVYVDIEVKECTIQKKLHESMERHLDAAIYKVE